MLRLGNDFLFLIVLLFDPPITVGRRDALLDLVQCKHEGQRGDVVIVLLEVQSVQFLSHDVANSHRGKRVEWRDKVREVNPRCIFLKIGAQVRLGQDLEVSMTRLQIRLLSLDDGAEAGLELCNCSLIVLLHGFESLHVLHVKRRFLYSIKTRVHFIFHHLDALVQLLVGQ